MRLRNIKRLIKEEFPEEVRGWIERLLSTINLFMEDVYRLHDKNINIVDNIDGQVNTFTFDGSTIIQGDTLTSSSNITNVLFNADGATPGQVIAGPGISPGTRVSSVSGTTVTLTNPPTIASTNANFTVGGSFPIIFRYNRPTRPQIVSVGQISDQSGRLIVKPVTIEWQFINGSIFINNITGLKAGEKYFMTVMSLSG